MVCLEYPNLTVCRHTRGDVPNLPYKKIRDRILGPNYELSLSFLGEKPMTELHRKWKKKSGPADILSFPLSKHEGEIVISLKRSRTQAPLYNRNHLQHLLVLIIHGMVHLTNLDHSPEMDILESRYQAEFIRTTI